MTTTSGRGMELTAGPTRMFCPTSSSPRITGTANTCELVRNVTSMLIGWGQGQGGVRVGVKLKVMMRRRS